MTQKMVATTHNIPQVFSELTMPQAVVIAVGIFAVSFVVQSAFKYGWAPDLDFSSNRYRFVHQSAMTPT